MKPGRLGPITIQGDNLLLGQPYVFTKEKIDQFAFERGTACRTVMRPPRRRPEK